MATAKTRTARKKRGDGSKSGGGKKSKSVAGLPSDEELEAEARELEASGGGRGLHIGKLQKMTVSELHELAESEGIKEYAGLKKQDLIFKLLKERASQDGLMYGEGVLEVLPDGFGFLRSPRYSYYPCPDDIYISPSQIRRFGISHRRGRVRPDPAAKGERTLLCAPAGGSDQL